MRTNYKNITKIGKSSFRGEQTVNGVRITARGLTARQAARRLNYKVKHAGGVIRNPLAGCEKPPSAKGGRRRNIFLKIEEIRCCDQIMERNWTYCPFCSSKLKEILKIVSATVKTET